MDPFFFFFLSFHNGKLLSGQTSKGFVRIKRRRSYHKIATAPISCFEDNRTRTTFAYEKHKNKFLRQALCHLKKNSQLAQAIFDIYCQKNVLVRDNSIRICLLNVSLSFHSVYVHRQHVSKKKILLKVEAYRMKIKPENTLFQAHNGGIYSTLFSTGISGRVMETFPRRNTPQPDAEKRVKAYVFLEKL